MAHPNTIATLKYPSFLIRVAWKSTLIWGTNDIKLKWNCYWFFQPAMSGYHCARVTELITAMNSPSASMKPPLVIKHGNGKSRKIAGSFGKPPSDLEGPHCGFLGISQLPCHRRVRIFIWDWHNGARWVNLQHPWSLKRFFRYPTVFVQTRIIWCLFIHIYIYTYPWCRHDIRTRSSPQL